MFTNLDPGTGEITDSKSAQKSGMNQIHVLNDPCLRCLVILKYPRHAIWSCRRCDGHVKEVQHIVVSKCGHEIK